MTSLWDEAKAIVNDESVSKAERFEKIHALVWASKFDASGMRIPLNQRSRREHQLVTLVSSSDFFVGSRRRPEHIEKARAEIVNILKHFLSNDLSDDQSKTLEEELSSKIVDIYWRWVHEYENSGFYSEGEVAAWYDREPGQG